MDNRIASLVIRNQRKRSATVRRVIGLSKINKGVIENKWFVLGTNKSLEMVFEAYDICERAIKRAIEIHGCVMSRGKEVEYKVIGETVLYMDKEKGRIHRFNIGDNLNEEVYTGQRQGLHI